MCQARLAYLRGDPTAQPTAREALTFLRAAVDNLDDQREQLDAHFGLDQAGRWVRATFGCSLEQDEKGYSRTCPVDLGHERWGSSIGADNAVRICMVCGQDARLCRHVAGRIYDARAQRIDGGCNVCGSIDACDHKPGETYPIVCSRLITKVDLREISIVSRPADTGARFFKISVSTEALRASLGPDGWEPGMPVSCDRCLHPCGGLLELGRGAPRQEEGRPAA